MGGFEISSGDGLILSSLPRPAEQFKPNKFGQCIEIPLPENVSAQQIHDLSYARSSDEKPKVHAYVGARNYLILDGQKIPVKPRLHLNSYLYKRDGDAVDVSLVARFDLCMPHTRKDNDAAILALQQGLANAQMQRGSGMSQIDREPLNKRQKTSNKQTLIGSFRGHDLKAHRLGLFDRSKHPVSRSLTSSPGLPAQINGIASLVSKEVSRKDARKREREDAIKISLIHLLAVRPVSAEFIIKTLRCVITDVETHLEKYGRKSRLDESKWELSDRGYKLLDPYAFKYPEDDRKRAIDRAVEAFDRMRLSSMDKEWQMLLPKAERGKNKCLSKLAGVIYAPPPKPSKQQSERLPTPTPEIHISDAGSPNSGHTQPDRNTQVSKRTSEQAFEGEEMKRQDTKKRARSSKNVVQPQENASSKQPPEELRHKKAHSPASLRRGVLDRKEATEVPKVQPKATLKKPAEKKMNLASNRKFKSAERITAADEEEAEAATRIKPVPETTVSKDKSKRATLSTSTPKPKTDEKPTTSGGKVAEAAAKGPASVASTQGSGLSEPKTRSKPYPLDKAKSDAKAEAVATALPGSQSRPATPTSSGLQPSRNKIEVKKLKFPVGPSSGTSPHHAPLARARPNHGKTSAAQSGAKAPAKLAAVKQDRGSKAGELSRKNPKGGMEPKLGKSATIEAQHGKAEKEKLIGATSTRPSSVASAVGPAEKAKSVPMQKTVSHQRKSSSPIKPSPLASSPPISASDLDERTDRLGARAKPAAPSKNLGPAPTTSGGSTQKPLIPSKPGQEGSNDRSFKRKACDNGNGSAIHKSSGLFERPAKRREVGAAASRSSGAGGSSESTKTGSNLLHARGHDPSDRNDSQSPSPASSTVGSSSTKDTSASLLSSTNAPIAVNFSKSKQGEGKAAPRDERINGFKKNDLQRAASFEEEMERYNALQRQVALMGNRAPVEKIRELSKMFHSLETQKKVLAALAASG